MTDVGEWYRSLPRFTRYWFTATVGLSLLARFGLPSIYYMFLSWPHIWTGRQYWRLLTSLFAYPLRPDTGFHFLMNCYFIVQYGSRLEKEQFARSPADFLFLQVIVSLLSIIAGLIFDAFFLMDLLVISVIYVWCQLNKDVTVNFWFGARFKAVYLPWVLTGIDFVLKHSLESLIGLFIGHLYFFLKFQYPQELGGNEFLVTPAFLKRWVPDISGGIGGFGVPPASRAQPATEARPANGFFRDTWGRGNTLGGH